MRCDILSLKDIKDAYYKFIKATKNIKTEEDVRVFTNKYELDYYTSKGCNEDKLEWFRVCYWKGIDYVTMDLETRKVTFDVYDEDGNEVICDATIDTIDEKYESALNLQSFLRRDEEIKRQNVLIIKAFLKDESISSGGCNDELEDYYKRKYSRSKEEIANLVLIAHAIALNQEIELV